MSPMARHKTTVRLDPDAARGWGTYLDQHNLTFNGLIETLGHLLAEGAWEPDETTLQRAHALDRQRGSRRSW